jgi:formamidopyrimidine-DNA glycosylase
MPELPEVTTTVTGLQKTVRGLTITDVWTDYFKNSKHHRSESVKNPVYATRFTQHVVGATITEIERRGKNILIHLSNHRTIHIHMKMTGHMLYGTYVQHKNTWKTAESGPLADPFNQFIHIVFSLSNGKHLVMSDMRKFGKIAVFDTADIHSHKDLGALGPEPLEITLSQFTNQLKKKPKGVIKTVLMDQSVIVGIGNIYSDEILWESIVHPLRTVSTLSPTEYTRLYKATQTILKKGIDFGGDSMSDYRNIHGERGLFQHKHNAYRKTGTMCTKRGCTGIIQRKIIGGRSAHFCNTHQL